MQNLKFLDKHWLLKIIKNYLSSPPPPEPHSHSFMPAEKAWVEAHYTQVPQQIIEFVGHNFAHLRVLDIGCGDCLIDYGLLNQPLCQLVGLDIVPAHKKNLEKLPQRLQRNGLTPPSGLERFQHIEYEGRVFPFADQSFDAIVSWSAFEHITDVPQILREIKRVLTPQGFAFIQVYPWFHGHHGSHLTDHIGLPFFQHSWTQEQVKAELERVAEVKTDQREFLLHHLWGEYRSLNQYSADRFYEEVKAAGFKARKVQLISFVDDLSEAPPHLSLSSLMIQGSLMLITPEKSPEH